MFIVTSCNLIYPSIGVQITLRMWLSLLTTVRNECMALLLGHCFVFFSSSGWDPFITPARHKSDGDCALRYEIQSRLMRESDVYEETSKWVRDLEARKLGESSFYVHVHAEAGVMGLACETRSGRKGYGV